MGLVPSLQSNPVNEQGIPTAITFSPDHPTVINFIQGVVKIPTGFDSVQDIKCTENQITIFSINHKTVSIGVNSDFIRNGIVKRY